MEPTVVHVISGSTVFSLGSNISPRWVPLLSPFREVSQIGAMMRRTLTCADEAKGWLSFMQRGDATVHTPVQRVAAVIVIKAGPGGKRMVPANG